MDHKVSKDMISSGMIPSGEKTQADLGRTQYGSAPSPSSLMEAYRSIYEHHQKDENGNTIPHKDEDIKEEDLHEVPLAPLAVAAGMTGASIYGANLLRKSLKKDKPQKVKTTTEGKMPEGLKNYLMKKNDKKEDKKDMKEGMASMVKAGVKAVKSIKKTMGDKPSPEPKPSPLPDKPSNPSPEPKPSKKPDMGSKPVSQMNDVDLFDLIKGRLIDEGCDEQEAIKIMVNASQDELNQISEGLPMIAKAGMAVGGALLAKKGLGDMKKKFDNFLNKQRDKGIGGNTRPGSDKIYYGK